MLPTPQKCEDCNCDIYIAAFTSDKTRCVYCHEKNQIKIERQKRNDKKTHVE